MTPVTPNFGFVQQRWFWAPHYTTLYPDRGIDGYGQADPQAAPLLAMAMGAGGLWVGWRLLQGALQNKPVQPRYLPAVAGAMWMYGGTMLTLRALQGAGWAA